MKKMIRFMVLPLVLLLASCYGNDDDSNQVCTGDCNEFTGRVYTEDGVGIEGVAVELTYSVSGIGVNHTRKIAKTKTDAQGHYDMSGYIKDNEFNSGFFYLTVNAETIENAVSDQFYRPSEIANDYPGNHMLVIGDLLERNQVYVADYLIPRKTTLTVNLTDFVPTSTTDQFGVGNRIRYGFNRDLYIIQPATGDPFVMSTATNATFTVPAVFGDNTLGIYRFKTGLSETEYNEVFVDNPNTVAPMSFSF